MGAFFLDDFEGEVLKLAEQGAEFLCVVEQGLVFGELGRGEPPGHGPAADLAGPFGVGAVQAGRIGVAAAVLLAAGACTQRRLPAAPGPEPQATGLGATFPSPYNRCWRNRQPMCPPRNPRPQADHRTARRRAGNAVPPGRPVMLRPLPQRGEVAAHSGYARCPRNRRPMTQCYPPRVDQAIRLGAPSRRVSHCRARRLSGSARGASGPFAAHEDPMVIGVADEPVTVLLKLPVQIAQPSTRLALVAAGQGHLKHCVSVSYARSPGAGCHAA